MHEKSSKQIRFHNKKWEYSIQFRMWSWTYRILRRLHLNIQYILERRNRIADEIGQDIFLRTRIATPDEVHTASHTDKDKILRVAHPAKINQPEDVRQAVEMDGFV
jgi:hypothetical protein